MGPLHGYRIVELAGIGPGPFCGMMLADMGAEVIQIVRPVSENTPTPTNVDLRGRRSVALDLKNPRAVEAVLTLCETADGLIEGFRPGVTEKLGLGPADCQARNPKLVYGRMTGWGQDGPWASRAGHDINYLGLSGALYNLGRAGEKPAIPLNYVADYGGGAMFLAFGLVCGLLEASRSGRGQVVDAAMVDGVAALQAMHYQFYNQGHYVERGTHLLGSGHHSYEVYETSDGQYMAVGALEPQFYAELIERLKLDADRFLGRSAFEKPAPPEEVEQLREELIRVFRTKTQAEWCDVFTDSDACVTPVLTPHQAAEHPHLKQRQTFLQREGQLQHQPAPRFSRTVPQAGHPPRRPGQDTVEVLKELDLDDDTMRELCQMATS